MTKTTEDKLKEQALKLSRWKSDLLGFELYAMQSESLSNAKETWRLESDDTRQAERDAADQLLKLLEAAGLKLKISSSAKLEKAVTELRTVPAQIAYTL